jgi:hypothetical protein
LAPYGLEAVRIVADAILRAAKATGSIVKIDIRTLECTLYPMPPGEPGRQTGITPDRPENWKDEHGKEGPSRARMPSLPTTIA